VIRPRSEDVRNYTAVKQGRPFRGGPSPQTRKSPLSPEKVPSRGRVTDSSKNFFYHLGRIVVKDVLLQPQESSLSAAGFEQTVSLASINFRGKNSYFPGKKMIGGGPGCSRPNVAIPEGRNSKKGSRYKPKDPTNRT